MRLVFDENAFEDLAWFVSNDPKLAKKIISLVQEVSMYILAEETFKTSIVGSSDFKCHKNIIIQRNVIDKKQYGKTSTLREKLTLIHPVSIPTVSTNIASHRHNLPIFGL